ncbi:MAG: hypothetical protein M0039_00945 [Pseudomonadota bacterium]|nr:hypothetical protein [Pseudomonadota bacterium]
MLGDGVCPQRPAGTPGAGLPCDAGYSGAGDATDQRDKQIIIAAGDGAQAALSADRFLAQQTKPEPPARGQHSF